MKKIIFCALVIWPVITFGAGPDIAVPNTPANGDVADVTKLNANFDYLEDILSFTSANGNNFTIGATNSPTIRWDEDNGFQNPTGVMNLGIGFGVLDKLRLGVGNVAYGWSALNELEDGNYNTAVGWSALKGITAGNYNSTVGTQAGFELSTGSWNVAMGVNALKKMEAGNNNVAIGFESMRNATLDNNNTSIGDSAMLNHTGGSNNVAIGIDALSGYNRFEEIQINVPTTGNSNVAVGSGALRENTGDYNVAIGANASSDAGHNFLRGVAIGFEASAVTDAVAIGSGAEATGENSVALGAGATVAVDNTIQIGGSAITSILTATATSVNSDARLKEAIVPVETGLALINDLKPVKYHRINNQAADLDMGLLAQDVESALIKHGMSDVGTVRNATEEGYRSVRYNDLLAPMIRAIQELDDASEAKDAQIASLQEQVLFQQGKLQSQQEELLALVQSQKEQIAQLQRMVEHQFVAR
mgnify:CR=1 FL=1